MSTMSASANSCLAKLLLSTVASQNNEGVHFLIVPSQTHSNKERAQTAITCFQNSMLSLKEAMDLEMIDLTSLRFEGVLPSPFCWMAVLPELAAEDGGSSALYVQDRAAAIDPVIFNARLGLTIVSMILIFNLGLAYHALANECDDKEAAQKAKRLYGFCVTTVAPDLDTLCGGGEMYSGIVWAMLVAARNNKLFSLSNGITTHSKPSNNSMKSATV